jgi:hypothetical protein
VQNALDVDVDHRRPSLDVEIRHRADLADARIAHQNIETPELRHGGADESIEIVATGDVGGADDGLPSSIAQCGSEFFEMAHPPGAEHNLRATLAEHPRCRFSDAAAGTRDGDDFSCDA